MDFRVNTDMADHPKTQKLIWACGEGAFRCLLRLFGHVRTHKWTGELTNMDIDDIEIAAGWSGEPGRLVEGLLKVGFLEHNETCYVIHDWSEHNSFAAKTQSRKIMASEAAKVKWEKKRGSDAERIQNECETHAKSMQRPSRFDAPLPTPTPTPTPIPIPEEKKEEIPPSPLRGVGSGQSPVSQNLTPRPADTSEANSPRPPASERTKQGNDGGFDAFWKAYPRKRSKGDAMKAWGAARKRGVLPALDTLLAKVTALARSPDWIKDGGQFIPYPASWIRGQGWEDEITASGVEAIQWTRPGTVPKEPPLTEEDLAKRREAFREAAKALKIPERLLDSAKRDTST